MAVNKLEKWTMPSWMEKYRHEIKGNGTFSVEELMNMIASIEDNLTLALRIEVVEAQVNLLERLWSQSLIK